MEALKKQIQAQYDEDGDIDCPICGSTDLSAGEVHAYCGNMKDKSPKAACLTTCRACGFDWKQIFKLQFGFEEK